MTAERRAQLEAAYLAAMAAVREPADLLAVELAEGRLAAHNLGEHLDRAVLHGTTPRTRVVEWSTPALPDAASVAERTRTVAYDLDVELVGAYEVTDGRTGLRLTRETADELRQAHPGPVDLAALMARVDQVIADVAAAGAGYGRRVDLLVGHDEPRPPRPCAQHPTGPSMVHGAQPCPTPPSAPEPPAPCASPGSLGRHHVPAGRGVRSCPCGAVTRVPAS